MAVKRKMQMNDKYEMLTSKPYFPTLLKKVFNRLHAWKSMKRHQKFFIFAFMVISAYLSARKLVHSPFFVQYESTKNLHAHIPTIKFLLDVLPWYSLVLFGCYCLGKLGIDMLSFRDCPQDIPKLAEVTFRSPCVSSKPYWIDINIFIGCASSSKVARNQRFEVLRLSFPLV